MRKIIFAFVSLFLLASCGVNNQTENTQTGTTTEANTTVTADDANTTKYVKYTLHDTDANGEVIDTNIDENGNVKTELAVDMSKDEVIPGFKKALMGMKEGETKTFTVSPEEGYGAATVTGAVEYYELAPQYTTTADKASLTGRFRETLNKADLGEEGKKLFEGLKNGDVVRENEQVKTIVIENSDNTVIVEHINKLSPFLDKEITVGLEATVDGATIKVTAIDGEQVALEVHNSNALFANNFEVGATAELPNNGGTVKILSLDPEHQTATVEMPNPNPHPLTGKTLYFEVTVEKVVNNNTPSSTTDSGTTAETNSGETTAQ